MNARQRRWTRRIDRQHRYWRVLGHYMDRNNPTPGQQTMRAYACYSAAEEHAVKVMRKKAGAR